MFDLVDFKAKPETTSTAHVFAVPAPPPCPRCRNHRLKISEKGHNAFCKFRHCKCPKCRLIDERQRQLTAKSFYHNQAEKRPIECIEDEINITPSTISTVCHTQLVPAISKEDFLNVPCDTSSAQNINELPAESLGESSDLNSSVDVTGLIDDWSKSQLAPLLHLLALSIADRSLKPVQETLSTSKESDKISQISEHGEAVQSTIQKHNPLPVLGPNQISDESPIETSNYNESVSNGTGHIEQQSVTVLGQEPYERCQGPENDRSRENQVESRVDMQCETDGEEESTQLEHSQEEKSANPKITSIKEDTFEVVSTRITELAERAATAATESMEEKIMQGLQNISLSESFNGDGSDEAQEILNLKSDIINIITGEIELKMEQLLLNFDKGLVLN